MSDLSDEAIGISRKMLREEMVALQRDDMTTIICPHCNGSVSIGIQVNAHRGHYAILTVGQMITALDYDGRREVYGCKGGGFAVSYGGGDVWPGAIQEAIQQGLIVEKYPGKKLECWRLAWPMT